MLQGKRRVVCIGAVLISFVFLSACGDHDKRKPSVESRLVNEACTLVLTPHAGDDADSLAIRRAQQQVTDGTLRLVRLERLGWAFVTKARSSFDPGFYRLAGLTAACMSQTQTDSVEALLLRGHALYSQHRFQETEITARELVERRGAWFDHALLGDARLAQGDLEDAVAAYERAMEQRPGPEMYARAAHVRWLTGEVDGAIEMMRLATRAGGGRDREAAAWRYERLAHYERQAGKAADAAKHIDAALRLQPGYPPALLEKGHLLIGEQRFEEALVPLAHAVAKNPLVTYRWAYMEALSAAGRHDHAASVAADMMNTVDGSDARTLSLYLATTEQDVVRALELARRERASRGDVHTLDALAWALQKNRRHVEAYELSQQSLAAGTRDARLYYHAGVIALANQRVDEASRWLESALALQHLLLPSERIRLNEEFAKLHSRIARLDS